MKINTTVLPRSRKSEIHLRFKNGEWRSSHDYTIYAGDTTAHGSYEGHITTRETIQFFNRERRKIISTIKKLKILDRKLKFMVMKMKEGEK